MVAQILRILVAVGFYMLWALQHAYLGISHNAQLYDSFFAASYFPLYNWAWQTLGKPLFPRIAFLLVAVEYTLGFMMLNHRPWARWGQLGGLVWNLLLAPFPWGWTNLILAGVHGWLYTQNFESSVLEALRMRRRAV